MRSERAQPQRSRATAAGRGSSRTPRPATGRGYAAIVVAGFFAVLGGLVLAERLPSLVLAIYAGASMVTFVSYGLDKSAARRGRWRIRENTLHLFALAGGWPGALLAQKLFRHKTRKQPFQGIFWTTSVLNCAMLAVFASPDALHAVLSFLGIPF